MSPTDYSALELGDRIILGMDNINMQVNIYLNLSKAFDTLDHKLIY